MTEMELPEKVPFDAALPLVTELMDRALLHSPEPAGGMMKHLAASRGKNFRAQLLLAAAADREGFVPRDALTAAAALEILHLATLVHDDVIDDSAVRRGRQSVQRRFGKKPAVICGDYLFCKCFLMTADLSRRYQDRFMTVARGMTRICMGELRQYEHNRDTSLSAAGYLRIIAGKTAALFSLALYAGGVLGGCAEKEIRLLTRLGYYIGVIFQLEDDCMDYRSDPSTAGKNVKKDLSEGVVTLPLIFAIAKNPEIRGELRGFDLTPEERRAVAAEVCRLGGVDRTLGVAGRYYKKAVGVLGRLEDPEKRALLRPILEQVKLRRY